MSVASPIQVCLSSWGSALVLSRSQKFALLAGGSGALLLALAGRLLRRRRVPAGGLPGGSLRLVRAPAKSTRPTVADSDSCSPGDSLRRRRRPSAATSAGSLRAGLADGGPLAPQQLGMMGMEALETAAAYWEDALAAYRSDGGQAVPSRQEAEFCAQLQRLLDSAGRLQAECEHMFLFYESALYRSSSATPVPNSAADLGGVARRALSDCSLDSFHSAEGEPADMDELAGAAGEWPLYQSALELYETDGIPFRTLRTARVGCNSDVEFVARLHCLRLGYQRLLLRPDARHWMVCAGRQLLEDLMLRAGRHPKDIIAAYDAMVTYLAQPNVWPTVKLELQARNVKCFTFYDIVLDYIILDAFDDLESPPATVLAVMQNRWLTSSFKESALNTAIWSVMKAKRQSLTFANGFKSHFYTLAEHLIPVLAWGLLGPDQRFGAVCQRMKEEMEAYVREIFDASRVRYTTVDELTEDLLHVTRQRLQRVNEQLRPEGRAQSVPAAGGQR
ncbi:Mitoguardin [Amphibalanus amphitrite]|uniref:Mitoguardin n=1 Tax=Amphibalanus amphitrite TaxID=1232801 RepID=A0A6A4WP41_AMPAM|nr:mitoguardin-like [Amphibalanus amphitrite]XP_043247115.1 mitoguardin-like [Amphibalanus amphitrite]XP_043247116.1 mitoguardin-like [Amphibalanus amphitrite]XP_043247117.1 mitoguardin-like [Amphibalanus amphitrite]KAF0303908.1 Mitoguardin [Amphibalanus amphitrite]